jgi:hypothetical protein
LSAGRLNGVVELLKRANGFANGNDVMRGRKRFGEGGPKAA